MPFYTFETRDKDVLDDKKVFVVMLTLGQYLEVESGKPTKEGWLKGKNGPEHPDTEQPVKTWRRRLDNVNCNFAQPCESSKWDSFEYRAGYNMEKAQGERRNAESRSHMGANPMQDQERCDLGSQDIETHEGRVE